MLFRFLVCFLFLLYPLDIVWSQGRTAQNSKQTIPTSKARKALFESSILDEDRDGLTIRFEANWRNGMKPDSAVSSKDLDQLLSWLTQGIQEYSHTVQLPVAAQPRLRIISSEYDEIDLDESLQSSMSDWENLDLVRASGLGISRKKATINVVANFLRLDQNGSVRRYRNVLVRVDYVRRASPDFRLATGAQFQENPHLSVDESVLANGTWIKIPITQEGVYKITNDYLSSIDPSLENADPRNFEIFGNGGAPLPARNEAFRPADLVRNQSLLLGGEDGRFDNGDALVFYAAGPSGWKYQNNEWKHYINLFSSRNYYFLRVTGGSGVSIPNQDQAQLAAPSLQRSFGERVFVEVDNELIPQDGYGSGLDWMGALIDETVPSRTVIDLGSSGIVGDSIRFNVRAAVAANPATDLKFNYEGQEVFSMRTLTAGPGTSSGYVARTSEGSFTVPVGPSGVKLEMALASTARGQRAWIDHVRAFVERQLLAENDFLRFTSSTRDRGETAMHMTSFSERPMVWDISSPGSYLSMQVIDAGGGEWKIEFDSSGESNPREFVAFTPSVIQPPSELGSIVQNQNLHGIADYPDLIIVTPLEFREQAERLAARRMAQGLRVTVSDIQEIYNEFSGGVPDMRAIRDYFKFLYDRSDDESNLLRYALLFGDGHYDFRSITEGDVELNRNWIFPYQSDESMQERRTYTSDDYFGILDDNEGIWSWPGEAGASVERMDIGVGRIPAQTLDEARLIVNKIEEYEDPRTHGPWRTRYTFVADDGPAGTNNDRDLHTQNADVVAEAVSGSFPEISQKKIYTISYPTVTTSSGRRIPDAKRDIVNAIEDGTLIWNYSGHGGIEDLADERIFTLEDIEDLENEDRLTIFVTATCTFGRFDTNRNQSGAEKLLFKDGGGSIAMFTTVRIVVTSTSQTQYNLGLNLELNQHLLGRDENGQALRLGDVMIRTKNANVGAQGNNRKFNLLGDPSMRVGLPELKANVNSINGISSMEDGLQLKALDLVRLEGDITRPDETVESSFNGQIQIEVFDSKRDVPIPEDLRRHIRDGNYSVQEDLIYRGGVEVQNGKFEVRFVVPKDIGYTNESGRISLYASSSESDALGVFENFIVGGTSNNPVNDSRGPEIELFLEDSTFVSGGLVSGEPELLVKIRDQSGVNTVGTGVGHEMLLVLDGDESNAVDIGERFQGDLGSFESGTVQFRLPNQGFGEHSLSVKVWDVANNSSEEFIDYVLVGDEKPQLGNVFAYPNPSAGGVTKFVYEHNQSSGTPANVRLLLYTVSGRLIKVIDDIDALPDGVLSGGYNQIEWDGLDDDGDLLASGVYLFRLELSIEKDGERQVADRIERLAVIR